MKKLLLTMVLLFVGNIYAVNLHEEVSNGYIKKYQEGYLRFKIPTDRNGIGYWYRCCDDFYSKSNPAATLIYRDGKLSSIVMEEVVVNLKNNDFDNAYCFFNKTQISLPLNEKPTIDELSCSLSLIAPDMILNKIRWLRK